MSYGVLGDGGVDVDAIDQFDDASLAFTVIPYRGAPVVSRAGWTKDAKSRGGIITVVPGGFFHDMESARFGPSRPYTYELPPVWLLVVDGIDYADDHVNRLLASFYLSADDVNQKLDPRKVVPVVGDFAKYAAWAVGGLVVLYGFSFLPRSRAR